MADFVNQAILQQLHARGTGPDPQAQLMQEAHLRLQQQQAAAAQEQQAFSRDMEVLKSDWVPTPDKLMVANRRAKSLGLNGQVTVDGLYPMQKLLVGLEDDLANNRDISAKSGLIEIFSKNPSWVQPELIPVVMDAQQQLQEQKVQQVAAAQVPSVEGGPEAMGRTQEARGRLAHWNAIEQQIQSDPSNPENARMLEGFTKLYGTPEKFQQQIEADKLVVQAEEQQKLDREKYAAALRLAPAELAKQAAASVDPKTMMLPIIKRDIQEYGIGNLPEKSKKLLEAHLVINGQMDKLSILGEGANANQRKLYEQDLTDAKVQLGAIDQVQKVIDTGKDQINAFSNAAAEALDEVQKIGVTPDRTANEKRSKILADLEQSTSVVAQDWEETIAPVRQELSKGAEFARMTVQELNKQLSRPGVDRVTLSKRKDFYQQQADTYEQMNKTLGVQSYFDIAVLKGRIKELEIEAEVGPDEQRRAQAADQAKLAKTDLAQLEKTVEKNLATLDTAKKRLNTIAKVAQLKITAQDKKQEIREQNGTMASAYVAEQAPKGFKVPYGSWYAENSKFFEGADPEEFAKIVKPIVDSSQDIYNNMGISRLFNEVDPKQFGTLEGNRKIAAIAKETGAQPKVLMDATKNPNQSPITVNLPDKSKQEATVEAAKDFTKSTRATYDQLKSAPILLRNIDEAKALIPQAKGFMGPGGESMLEAAKFLNARIGAKINTEGVKSAEELRTRIFFNIMENLKKMDAQPSEMQQMMMRDALGKLGTDPNALANVLDAYGDTIRDKVELFNNEVSGAEKKGTQFPYDPRIILPPRKSATGEPMVRSDAEYQALPPGTVYIGPDGKKRTKK